MRGYMAFAISLLALSATIVPSAAQDLRPNHLVIMLDDDNQISRQALKMTRKLVAGKGITIENFVMPTPSCAPSRATFFRGQYPHNHQVLTNKDGYPVFRKTGAEKDTIATRLNAGGYNTAFIGKYINLWGKGQYGDERPPGWTFWASTVVPNEKPTAWFQYRLHEGDKLTVFGSGEDPRKVYEPSVVANLALRYLNKLTPEKPFFMVVNMRPPHEPATPHPDFVDAPMPDIKHPPSFGEDPASPRYKRLFPALNPEQTTWVLDRQARRYRSMMYVDKLIVKILNALERQGRLANTYVWVVSDNGMMEGEHSLRKKGMPYEESLVAPLWVRGPGVVPGRADFRLAGMHDIAPTILRIAGLPVPNFMDGRDLRPLLYAQTGTPWRTAILGEFYAGLQWTAVRRESFKLIVHKDGFHEMYDLLTDRYERRNLFGKPEQRKEAGLVEQLKQLKTCGKPGGVSCRTAEGP